MCCVCLGAVCCVQVVHAIVAGGGDANAASTARLAYLDEDMDEWCVHFVTGLLCGAFTFVLICFRNEQFGTHSLSSHFAFIILTCKYGGWVLQLGAVVDRRVGHQRNRRARSDVACVRVVEGRVFFGRLRCVRTHCEEARIKAQFQRKTVSVKSLIFTASALPLHFQAISPPPSLYLSLALSHIVSLITLLLLQFA